MKYVYTPQAYKWWEIMFAHKWQWIRKFSKGFWVLRLEEGYSWVKLDKEEAKNLILNPVEYDIEDWTR